MTGDLREYHRARQAEHRARLRAIKLERGCTDCGTREGRLEFDHVPERGAKKRSIANMVQWSWSAILEEVAKCDVVCRPCHAVRTRNRGQYTFQAKPPTPAQLARSVAMNAKHREAKAREIERLGLLRPAEAARLAGLTQRGFHKWAEHYGLKAQRFGTLTAYTKEEVETLRDKVLAHLREIRPTIAKRIEARTH